MILWTFSIDVFTLNIGYEDNKWYYLEMQKLFNAKLEENKLLNRYNEIVDVYFK